MKSKQLKLLGLVGLSAIAATALLTYNTQHDNLTVDQKTKEISPTYASTVEPSKRIVSEKELASNMVQTVSMEEIPIVKGLDREKAINIYSSTISGGMNNIENITDEKRADADSLNKQKQIAKTKSEYSKMNYYSNAMRAQQKAANQLQAVSRNSLMKSIDARAGGVNRESLVRVSNNRHMEAYARYQQQMHYKRILLNKQKEKYTTN